MSAEIHGYVGVAREEKYVGFHCLSVYPKYGTNEVNFFRDDEGTRTYLDMSLDYLSQVKFDIFDEGSEHEFVKITTTDKDGNMAMVYLHCPVNVLLNAIEAERMALQAPKASEDLS